MSADSPDLTTGRLVVGWPTRGSRGVHPGRLSASPHDDLVTALGSGEGLGSGSLDRAIARPITSVADRLGAPSVMGAWLVVAKGPPGHRRETSARSSRTPASLRCAGSV
jgi:hypothetical protein